MPRPFASSASVHSGSTARVRDDDRSTIRDHSPPFEYPGADADEQPSLSYDDYTAQRDLILEDDQHKEDDADDDFIYTGVDAEEPQAYDAQLADALGGESTGLHDEQEEQEEKEVEDEPRGGRTFRFADRMADVSSHTCGSLYIWLTWENC